MTNFVYAKANFTMGQKVVAITNGVNVAAFVDGDMVFVEGFLPFRVAGSTLSSLTLKDNAPATLNAVDIAIIAGDVPLRDVLDQLKAHSDAFAAWFSQMDAWLNELGTVNVVTPSGTEPVSTLPQILYDVSQQTQQIQDNLDAIGDAGAHAIAAKNWAVTAVDTPVPEGNGSQFSTVHYHAKVSAMHAAVNGWYGQVNTWQEAVNTKHGQVNTWYNSINTWQAAVSTKHGDVEGWHTSVNGWQQTVGTQHTAIQGWYNSINTWQAAVNTKHGQVSSWHTAVNGWQQTVGTQYNDWTTNQIPYVEQLKADAELARDQAQQAAQGLTGGLFFAGSWSSNSAPPTPSEGSAFYKITGACTVNGIAYAVGDSIIYDNIGGTWFKLDSTDQVTSVCGKIGAVTLTAADVGARPSTWVPSWSEVTGKPTFAAVATSGSYTDLSNKPTLSSLGGVPTTRTVNGKQLSANISIGIADISGLDTALAGGATTFYYDPSGTFTLTRQTQRMVILCWSNYPTIYIDGSTFQTGDEIVIINQRGTGVVTFRNLDGAIYKFDGTSTAANVDNTLSKAGAVRLVNYNGSSFMGQAA
ncbi:hypothetical protein [Bowmanella dokdonensis]|uniref:Tail fiber protein n=1 Tax=Bowmanella dokdonensis TaxID=751969 RepID=A0A939DM54_9ALTE|nr:hypothetical protein [Bowmanella dokdonensis]MBN7824787.1 hypothetical protein [Bowmanella dokdonensis]